MTSTAQIIAFPKPQMSAEEMAKQFVCNRLAEAGHLAIAAATTAHEAHATVSQGGGLADGGELIRQLVSATMAAILASGCQEGDLVLMTGLANWTINAGGRL